MPHGARFLQGRIPVVLNARWRGCEGNDGSRMGGAVASVA